MARLSASLLGMDDRHPRWLRYHLILVLNGTFVGEPNWYGRSSSLLASLPLIQEILMNNLGGCLCGALRYQVNDEPIDSGYCHCRICQRSAGAPVLVWATFSVQAFIYTQGIPAVYRSSDRYQREFCGSCGTQIAFRQIEGAMTIDVTVTSLDDPAIFSPEYHIWTQSQVAWFDLVDRLPRYKDSGPE